jgi:hypothetical protein
MRHDMTHSWQAVALATIYKAPNAPNAAKIAIASRVRSPQQRSGPPPHSSRRWQTLRPPSWCLPIGQLVEVSSPFGANLYGHY